MRIGNIASESDENKSALTAVVDDVKIYNYTRTPKQIVEDMNAGHPAGGSPVGSQVGYWKFDEGYGATTYDSIGNIDGSITGASWTNDGKFSRALAFTNGRQIGMMLSKSLKLDIGYWILFGYCLLVIVSSSLINFRFSIDEFRLKSFGRKPQVDRAAHDQKPQHPDEEIFVEIL